MEHYQEEIELVAEDLEDAELDLKIIQQGDQAHIAIFDHIIHSDPTDTTWEATLIASTLLGLPDHHQHKVTTHITLQDMEEETQEDRHIESKETIREDTNSKVVVTKVMDTRTKTIKIMVIKDAERRTTS